MMLYWLCRAGCLLAICGNAIGQSPGDNNCTLLPTNPADEIAYIGWPHLIDCIPALEESLHHYYYDDYEDDEYYYCKIFSANLTKIYENEIDLESLPNDDVTTGYLLPDLHIDDVIEYIIFVNISSQTEKCFTKKIKLNVTSLPPSTCQIFESEKMVFGSHSVGLGDSRELSCEVFSEDYPKLYTKDDVTYEWRRNCSSLLPQGVATHEDGRLTISDITYEHAGLYTCSVTYNNRTRFISFYEFCVFRPLSLHPPSLTCSVQVAYKKVGDDVIFECVGNFGKGHITSQDFNFEWKKQNSIEDVAVSGNIPSSCSKYSAAQPSDHAYCYYILEQSCFLHVANEAERENDDALVYVRLVIRNIQQSDFGHYNITVIAGIFPTPASQTCVLNPDLIPDLLTQAQIAGICIGVLCILLILMGVALYHRIYIRVYYKRYFGKYEQQDRKYGAFFEYQYSEDINQFSQDDVTISVHHLHRIFQELGFQVYDERRDGYNHPNRVENVRMSIERSHRIVILLTLEFIKDGWSMLALQTGFDGMIQSGSKLIFILLPGMKEYLKQHSKNNDTCRMIQRAMKMNYAIKWSNQDKFDQNYFRMQLEDAMPKLWQTTFSSI